MYKVQKPCKICGKMFTPCADCENDKTIFHWRRITCSPGCAKKYFAKIEESRQTITTETTETIDMVSENITTIDDTKPKKTKKKNIINEESEQID